MADDKLKTGLEEQQVPESPGPAEPGGSPTPEQPAPEHPGPEAPQEENTPAAPSGKVIDLTEARAAGEKTAEGPAVPQGLRPLTAAGEKGCGRKRRNIRTGERPRRHRSLP